MKIITVAFAVWAITASAAEAQSMPVTTSYESAREQLAGRDQTGAGNRTAAEAAATREKRTGVNRRIGQRLGYSPSRPQRLMKRIK